ncbi:MAG: helix-turn-helix domain-containing protein [Nocardiopsaceae bacterium]|nr:helix-turn-helix domain-containing protein [Nocardiopsaceae bacterium]
MSGDQATSRVLVHGPRPRMFRIRDVVTMTGLSRSVIYEQIRAGRLRAVKQGKATLVTDAALDDYVRLLEREAEA